MRSCCASRTGSPPRMRGKVCTYSATEHGYGITPAYAGKSRPDPEPDAGTGDHPRVCGEKLIPPLLGFGFTGSPPRMRGKAFLMISPVLRIRITPAYAGKSFQILHYLFIVWDHPRVCGEKAGKQIPRLLHKGSPPRMRGKVLAACLHNLVNGITPAYAGKRCSPAIQPMKKQDHPRVCGEKLKAIYQRRNVKGSPPRMRGKAGKHKRSKYQRRITPAYAGKRRIPGPAAFLRRDHPRVCGEKH